MPLDDDAVAAMYGSMTERTLLDHVRQAMALRGWLVYHTHDSRRSEEGFPDIIGVRGDRVIFRELKTQKGRLTLAQQKWGETLLAAGADYGVWRPGDWGHSHIHREIE